MGLLVNIYKDSNSEYDCTNRGESSYAKGFTVINADGPFEPSEDYPAAKIVMVEPMKGLDDMRILRLIPESVNDKQTSFGGNFAHSSDSRFANLCEELLGYNFYGAVAIHDRVETFNMI